MAPPIRPIIFQPHNPDDWKPPDEWKCRPSVDKAIRETEDLGIVAGNKEKMANSISIDLASMQREVKRMAAASPRIILVRLNEEWDSGNDASLYKELEMEKKQWMLSALYNMNRPKEDDSLSGNQSLALKNGKKLALFECQGTYPVPRHC
jgi:hypothetical protein